MAELASGSEEAAWKIAEVYTPHILRVVRASLPAAIRPKLDSQDFAQIVWTSLLLKRSYLSRVKTSEQLIRLLATVAQHKVIDAFRHYTTYKARDLSREVPMEQAMRPRLAHATAQFDGGVLDRSPSPSQFAAVREKWQTLSDSLSARDRAILRWRYKGCTYAEIAEKLGVSCATVRRVLDRIIEQLQT